MDRQEDEVRKMMASVALRLENKHSSKAEEAKHLLSKTISTAADLIQIVSFLTGIVSLPSMINTDLVKEIGEFLRNLKSSLAFKSSRV